MSRLSSAPRTSGFPFPLPAKLPPLFEHKCKYCESKFFNTMQDCDCCAICAETERIFRTAMNQTTVKTSE